VWVEPRDHKIVGEIVAAARRRANLTQDELAARLQKPQSFVSAFEAGKRRVDVAELLLIVRAIGADPLEIFGSILSAIRRAEE
jgi:transcriptional regulator with XRE-family HTH domain